MRTTDPHKTTTEVRQADRSRGTLWMLLIGVIVIGIVFFALWWWFTLSTPPTAG